MWIIQPYKQNSTHSRRVRQDVHSSDLQVRLYFNPRTLAGCDRITPSYTPSAPVFQSTHPHGVRPNLFFLPRWWNIISIHAPSWGATAGLGRHDMYSLISIHAPSWGATQSKSKTSAALSNFNPRTLMGCDRKHRGLLIPSLNFNPRTLMGCDLPLFFKFA